MFWEHTASRILMELSRNTDLKAPDGNQPHAGVDELVANVVEMLLKCWKDQNDPSTKILGFKPPDELQKIFDLKLDHGGNRDEIMGGVCRDIINFSLHSGHPAFFNQLWGGLDKYGLLGAWMVEVLHTSVYTYEVAPLFTLMENYLIRHIGKDLVGFPVEEEIDGLFNPGGSISNILGLHLARFKLNPLVKTDGNAVFTSPLIILASEESHYSLLKGAALIGLGSSNVWKVECDENGRMRPDKLDEKIREAKETNKLPFIVCATSGTTVLGAYDPLDEIADICQKHFIWMHVDAAWGGTAMFSSKLKHLVHGIHRADSVIWNPHKMLGIPLQCAMFLTRHKNLLSECNSNKSSYLFQSDKTYDMEYDIGDKTFMCGRKNDALKLWLTWKGRGKDDLIASVENAFDMSRYFADLIRNREGFQLVLPEVQCTNVCFWFIPPSLRKDVDWKSDAFKETIGKVAPKLKEKMMKEGTLFIGYQPIEHRKLPNFFRLVIHCNPKPTKASMEFVVDELERLGASL